MARRRVKLSIAGPLVVALVLALMLAMLTWVNASSSRVQARQRAVSNEQQTLATWAKLLFNPLYNLDVSSLHSVLDTLLGAPEVIHIAARDINGHVMAEATDTWVPDKQISDELTAQALSRREVAYRESGGYLVLSSPISSGMEQIGTLTIAVDLEQIKTPIGWSTYVTILLVSTALIAGATILVAIFSRSAVLTPIRALVAASDEIERGKLDATIPARGLVELATLGQAMEGMRAELQKRHTDQEQQAALQELRAQRLLATAVIAQDIMAELDTVTLPERIVTSIGKRFALYNVALFLLDETEQWIELSAGSSHSGQRQVEHGLRLRLGESSIVGYVTRRNEPYLVPDVEQDPIYLHHPDLPDTRSELALPLRVRGENLGALDLQSNELNAFSQQDVDIWQALANHVALAMSNARRFWQAQQVLEGAQQAYGEVSYKAWAELLRSQSYLGYYSDADGLIPLAERPPHDDESLPELNVPITVRGRAIGSIRACKPASAGKWTPEETTLLETLTEQLNVALESARLHQATQRSAAQERLVGEITARMRESLDLDTVMQIAAREIGETLGLHDVTIQLETK